MAQIRPLCGGTGYIVSTHRSYFLTTEHTVNENLDIYNCAAVVHTARLCHSLKNFDGIKTLQENFNDCLQCLDKYENYGLPAKRCRTALQILERRAFPVQPVAADTSDPQGRMMFHDNNFSAMSQSDIDLLLTDSSTIGYPFIYGGTEGGMFGMNSDDLFLGSLMPVGNSFAG
jgi:hypothetical protein